MGNIINRRMRDEAQKEINRNNIPSGWVRPILAIPRPEVTVVHPVRIGQGWRPQPTGRHHFMNGVDGLEGGFVPDESLRQSAGCPSVFVGLIPDIDTSAAIGQESHDLGKILVGSSVHGCFSIGIHGVEVFADRDQPVECLQHF